MSDLFKNFVEDTNWNSLEEHYRNFSDSIEKNIDSSIEKDRSDEMREHLIKNGYVIKTENESIQNTLKNELYGGNTVAVDGTCAHEEFLSGFQARIAVVAVNYKNNRTDYSTYVYEPFLKSDKTEIVDILRDLKAKDAGKAGLHSSAISAIMLYKERKIILERSEKYKIVHGDLIPYELKTGQGRLRALNLCLSLGRDLLENKNLVSVQTSTTRRDLMFIGTALNRGEYIELKDYQQELSAFLYGDEFSNSNAAHFNPEDKKLFETFIKDAENKFSLGIYKSSERAYVYYAPKSNFEEMTNLIMLDSKPQSVRGVPLLLDYADIICSRLFPGSEFKRMIDTKMARKKILASQMNEKKLRRR